jgi:hypothetical protein
LIGEINEPLGGVIAEQMFGGGIEEWAIPAKEGALGGGGESGGGRWRGRAWRSSWLRSCSGFWLRLGIRLGSWGDLFEEVALNEFRHAAI